MKLSKKSQARQKAIAKMVASGKALGGLLVGLVAAAIPGCRDNSSGARMGDYPCPPQEQKPNSGNEKHGRNPAVRGKYLCEPEKTNEKNESEPLFEEGGDVQIISAE